jgi:Tic20 family protein import component
MILSGSLLAPIGTWKANQYNNVSSFTPLTFSKNVIPNISCSWTQGLNNSNPRGSANHLAALSSPLTADDDVGLFPRTTHIISPLRLHKRHTTTNPPQAFFQNFFKIRLTYPPMEEKPKFWWRVLACLPYLMPIHETWMYAETAYNLHPFLESFEYMTYPFLRSIGSLPRWSLMAYFFTAYLGIVRVKIWPHFFRYHVVLGMLLEISLQVTGTMSRWAPRALYWGKIGMHFWTVVAFSFLFTVIECMRCAILGMYADVPFLSKAACVQIPVEQARPKQ